MCRRIDEANLKGVFKMRTNGLFDKTLQKTHDWIKDVMLELEWDDRQKAYHAFRVTLQTLRDRLTLEEVAQLGAQLPMLVRGFYYEGWNPTGKPLKQRHKAEFLAPIEEHFWGDETVDAEEVARAVFKVLARRVSAGEIEDVKHVLPKELRELLPKAASFD
jgi:uncharacterized protein (DUF2267 family)